MVLPKTVVRQPSKHGYGEGQPQTGILKVQYKNLIRTSGKGDASREAI
jgi:hypothetical protein